MLSSVLVTVAEGCDPVVLHAEGGVGLLPGEYSLYIPSSYITKKLSEVASSGSPLTCSASMAMDSDEKPLDMSKTSSIFRPIKREVSGATRPLEPAASHRDLFPGLYLLVDTALEVHGRGRPVPVAPLQG